MIWLILDDRVNLTGVNLTGRVGFLLKCNEAATGSRPRGIYSPRRVLGSEKRISQKIYNLPNSEKNNQRNTKEPPITLYSLTVPIGGKLYVSLQVIQCNLWGLVLGKKGKHSTKKQKRKWPAIKSDKRPPLFNEIEKSSTFAASRIGLPYNDKNQKNVQGISCVRIHPEKLTGFGKRREVGGKKSIHLFDLHNKQIFIVKSQTNHNKRNIEINIQILSTFLWKGRLGPTLATK